jgi:hypothetical protein
MTTYQIELDISHEATDELVEEFATSHGCTYELIQLEGPAGGNPVYLFKSDNFHNVHELASEILQYDATDVIEQVV